MESTQVIKTDCTWGQGYWLTHDLYTFHVIDDSITCTISHIRNFVSQTD